MGHMNNFKEYRLRANLSQMQLAEELHVSQACVSRWENSNAYPEIESGRKLSAMLHISLDELYDNPNKFGSFEIPVYQRISNMFEKTACTRPGALLFLSYREMEMLYPRAQKKEGYPEISSDYFFGFYCADNMMKPVIRADSINVIFKTDAVYNGAIHLVSMNEEDCTLARLTKLPHSILAVTDIENGTSEEFKSSKLHSGLLKVFGVVVQTRNNILL